MEEKHGKLNKKFRGKTKHLILSKMKKTTESSFHARFQKNTRNIMKAYQQTPEETQIQCRVEKEFQQITNRQEDKKEGIT